MISLTDCWLTDRPTFEGQRCLMDAAENNSAETSGHAIARMFVIQAASRGLREACAAGADERGAAPYVAALFDVDDPECGALFDCLAAIRQHDTTQLAAALQESARMCAARGAAQTARNFAELSYEAALAVGAWEHAQQAALILERLAELDECPRSAELWARRAAVHGRRVQRRRWRRI